MTASNAMPLWENSVGGESFVLTASHVEDSDQPVTITVGTAEGQDAEIGLSTDQAADHGLALLRIAVLERGCPPDLADDLLSGAVVLRTRDGRFQIESGHDVVWWDTPDGPM